MRIKAILLDDEADALEYNASVMNQLPDLEIIGSYSKMEDAEVNIVKYRPDILFLDIRLQVRFVFEMIDRLKQRNMQFTIIFVSAFIDDHLKDMVSSIGLSHKITFDFLEKPIDIDKLKIQLEQFRSRILPSTLSEDRKSILLKDGNKVGYSRYLFNRIIYIESDNKYTSIYYHQKDKISEKVHNGSLKKLEGILPFPPFYRMSAKHIINMNFVASVKKERQNWYCCFEVDGEILEKVHQLPIPEKKWMVFKNKFGIA